MALVSQRIWRADAAFAPVRDFYFGSRYGERRGNPEISDFTFGNPHEMPLEGLVSALQKRAVPENKDWFAYKTSEDDARGFVAERLGDELGLAFDPEDIAMTAGAFAAIMVAFRLLLDAGDEAVYSEPAWFCYEPMLAAADAVPVKVPLKAPSFDLDLAAIEAAIGPKTRLVIVNSPQSTDRPHLRPCDAAGARRAARPRLRTLRSAHLPAFLTNPTAACASMAAASSARRRSIRGR
jgi:aspartate aminotransferase